MAVIAVLVGAGIVYAGDKLLGVTLEHYYGVGTFSPAWILALFFVPFVAGIVVSLIYGLGGKMWAHLSPVIVRVYSYYELHAGAVPPEGAVVLPMAYWLLIVIVAAEFAAFGGVVGEVVVKRVYGRTPKERLHRLHKKYQKTVESDRGGVNTASESQAGGVKK
jgi:hypothetical protein